MSTFNPNWVSAPGETIKDILEDRNITIEKFVILMDSDIETINSLLIGEVIIDEKISLQLQSVLGSSKTFWLKREENYRTRKNKLKL